MHRTQIYLSEAEIELLDREATRTGASRSELIRRAVRRTYGKRSAPARREALLAAAGAWGDRTVTGEEYVEALRSGWDERLDRLGLG